MHVQPIFITGIGTGIGKTVISAIIAEALGADYWKPVQAGVEKKTDSELVKELVSNQTSVVHPELYRLSLAASPHIAAKNENIKIDLDRIKNKLPSVNNRLLIVEGAGGLLVPLNENEFVLDLIEKINAKVILVSRNYLGSINHSLLTAAVCKQRSLNVIGWTFNDEYMNYEEEIVQWTGIPKIGSIPFAKNITKEFISGEAKKLKDKLQELL